MTGRKDNTMTFREFWKVFSTYGKLNVTIDFRCDYDTYTDYEDIAKIAKSDYLGRSTVDSVHVDDDGTTYIDIIVPNEDMGQIDATEDDFGIIFGTNRERS